VTIKAATIKVEAGTDPEKVQSWELEIVGVPFYIMQQAQL
jgi:hypothetical protein